MLPIHFPAWQTVYWWFRRLARRLMFRTMHDVALMIDRALADRAVEPTAAVIDSQTIKAPAPGAERGYDGAKKTVGRKRHIAVDTSGRLLLVHLTPANVSDSAGAQAVLNALHSKWPWIEQLFADSAYDRRQLMDKAAFLDIVKRTEAAFVVLPRRWVVERTLGWMTRHRRLVRDYEARVDVSETMIDVAMSGLMLRRVIHPSLSNGLSAGMVVPMRDMVVESQRLPMARADRLAETLAEHRATASCLTAGDVEGAMKAHIRAPADRYGIVLA